MNINLEEQLKRCPSKVVAHLCGCSERHLRDLAKRGEIKRVGRGKYNLLDVITYIRKATIEEMTPMQQAQYESLIESARKLRLTNDEVEDSLIPKNNVKVFVDEFSGFFLDSVDNLRKRVSPVLPDTRLRKKLIGMSEQIKSDLIQMKQQFKDKYDIAE